MGSRFKLVPILAILAIVALAVAPAEAQTPTGSISGRVVDSAGLRVPGVTVTLSSPNMQGIRTAVSSENGDYLFPSLQPGEYTLSFELAGFSTLRETRGVAAGQPVTVEVTMSPAAVNEVVTVSGRTDAFTNTVQASTTIRGELLQQLPSTRTLVGAVNLAPGVHATGPNNSFSISGAMSFENVFLLNGVQITDNIRGTPFNLFIEDAIQETTVSTSGISAEYGRFTGGVVNAVTKSGGSQFSGSYRSTFTNDDWRTRSPFDEPKTDAVVPVQEFTLGGPILRDRTWFFGAGRLFGSTVSNQTGFTNLPYEFEVDEKRFEGKRPWPRPHGLVRDQSRPPHAASERGLLLLPAGRVPHRGDEAHRPGAQLRLAAAGRRSPGTVRAVPAAERVRHVPAVQHRHECHQHDRADRGGRAGALPGVQPVHRHAGAGRALRLRPAVRPGDWRRRLHAPADVPVRGGGQVLGKAEG